MLETCFIHLPGVGPAINARLNNAGIVTWNDALARDLPCGALQERAIKAGIEESCNRLAAGDARWFGDRLPPCEQWRLFPHFRDSAAYVDIETSGLSRTECYITTIALYDGSSVRTYVRGENLESFADDILRYRLLVTWNGRGFDAPILRNSLRIPLDKGHLAHLDLLPVFRALGLRGGLKAVEKKLGIGRNALDGVDGFAAVRLWMAYERSNDRRFLETLLAYNAADVISLERLAEYALMRYTEDVPESARPAPVKYERNPFVPDTWVLRTLLGIETG